MKDKNFLFIIIFALGFMLIGLIYAPVLKEEYSDLNRQNNVEVVETQDFVNQ